MNIDADLGFDPKGTLHRLVLTCDLGVHLASRESPDIDILDYRSRYRGEFAVRSSSGISKDADFSSDTIEAQARVVTFIAVGRAQATLAETGYVVKLMMPPTRLPPTALKPVNA